MARTLIYPGARTYSLYLMPHEYKAIKEWLYVQRYEPNTRENNNLLYNRESIGEEDYSLLENSLLTEDGELVVMKRSTDNLLENDRPTDYSLLGNDNLLYNRESFVNRKKKNPFTKNGH